MKQDVQHCIQECIECHRICQDTIHYCLQQGGEHAEPDHVRLLLDCAQICQTAADFMMRNSDLHPVICEACAEVCQQCFESCDQFDHDAPMRTCAEACRRCAEACQQIAV